MMTRTMTTRKPGGCRGSLEKAARPPLLTRSPCPRSYPPILASSSCHLALSRPPRPCLAYPCRSCLACSVRPCLAYSCRRRLAYSFRLSPHRGLARLVAWPPLLAASAPRVSATSPRPFVSSRPRLVGLRVSPPPRPLVYSKPSTLFSCIPSSLFSPTHLTPNSLPPLPPSSYLHTHLLVVLFVYFSSYRAN